MNKFVLLMVAMAGFAIGAELEGLTWDNVIRLLGASDRLNLGAEDSEADESKKEIPGFETIPTSMMLKDDVFYSGYYPVDTDGQDMFYMLFESR